MIRERDRLARSPAHETALACIEAGIEAAHPERVVEDSVSLESDSLRVADATYDLAGYDKVVVVGGGKAAAGVAAALESRLGEALDGGVRDDDPADGHRLACGLEGLDVAVLLVVDQDDVEGAVVVVDGLDGVAEFEPHRRVEVAAGEVVAGVGQLVGVDLGEDEFAVGGQPAGEPVGGVAVAGPELEDAVGVEEADELLEPAADGRPDGRKARLGGPVVHLP